MARRGGDEDDVPWLAAADEEPRHTLLPGRGLMLIVVGLSALALLVVGLVYAVVERPGSDDVYADATGEVPLIRAPDAPYKVRPVDPGGMDVDGMNQLSFEAAGGLDPGGDLALDALPEEPMQRPVAGQPAPPPVAVAQAAPAPKPAAPAMAVPEKPMPVAEKPKPVVVAEKPKPAPAKSGDRLASLDKELSKAAAPPASDGGSYALQLGAFSTQAKANDVWKDFSGRYSYLKGLEKSVVTLERDGQKLYRLRATGVTGRATADNLCARLRVAGEQCSVAQ
jgi:cell division septation protein DedD